MDRWRPKSDEAKIEFQNAVMVEKKDKREENLGTIQKILKKLWAKWL